MSVEEPEEVLDGEPGSLSAHPYPGEAQTELCLRVLSCSVPSTLAFRLNGLGTLTPMAPKLTAREKLSSAPPLLVLPADRAPKFTE